MTGRTATGHAIARIATKPTARSHAGASAGSFPTRPCRFRAKPTKRIARSTTHSDHQYSTLAVARTSGIAHPSAIVIATRLAGVRTSTSAGAASHNPTIHSAPKLPENIAPGSCGRCISACDRFVPGSSARFVQQRAHAIECDDRLAHRVIQLALLSARDRLCDRWKRYARVTVCRVGDQIEMLCGFEC